MPTVQPAFAVQAKHQDCPSESDSPYFARATYDIIHYALFGCGLCLHIGINAR